jgi:hypothetical protein
LKFETSFVTEQSPSERKKRATDDGTKRSTKRFGSGRQHQAYTMEQDSWEKDNDDEQYGTG